MSIGLPFQRHSQTSKAAAIRAKGSADTTRSRVLDLLKKEGPLTDEEIQVKLQMNPSTQRPRCIELVTSGSVEATGNKRKTRSGSLAGTWRAV